MKFMREAFVRVWRDTRFPRRHQPRTRDKLRLLQHEQLEQRIVLTLPVTQTSAEGHLVVYNGPTVDVVNDTPSFDAFIDFAGDVDSFFFVPQFTGAYTIDVGDVGNAVDPEVAVYVASTGARIGYNDDLSAFNDDARLVINLTADVRYIIAVADQPAAIAGDVSITISAPLRTGSFLLTPDAVGDASAAVLVDVPTDIDYYSITAPADANGGLTISAAAGTLNPRLALFNSSGTLLQGPLAAISISNAVPGQEYRIGVYSNNYATSGSTDLLINFATERPDIRMTSATGNGGTGIAITYEITNGNVAPFNIDIFQSNDALMDNADTKIGTFSPGPADRTLGVHTVNLTLGSGITLPGAGITDLNTDYRLLFTADSANLVEEPDVDPLNEDNTVAFAGVYHQPSGPVMVYGTDSADTLTIKPNGLSVEVKFNSLVTASYATSDVTQFRVRGAGSDDNFNSGADNATMSIPLAIWGGAGLDTMVGGDGNDILSGGADNDVYVLLPSEVVESDTIDEVPGGGRDMIDFSQLSAAVTLNLGSTAAQGVNLGRLLTLTSSSEIEDANGGSAADSLIGNSNANQLVGFGDGDTLNGGAGSDTLLGGPGDDIYILGTAASSEADQITENANEGTDTLSFATQTTSVILSLGTTAIQPAHTNRTVKLNSVSTFENLIGGSGADSLTGNSLSNTLTGGAGDDKLNGTTGNDLLFGGLNNDTYIFGGSSAGEADQITENSNEGTDTLNFAAQTTSVTLSLATTAIQPAHTNRTVKLNSVSTFENLIGGSGADSLTGNSLSNTLTGGTGDDKLNGTTGNDLLFGGLNNDTYLFGASSVGEADQITENASEGTDTLSFATQTTSVTLSLATTDIQPAHTNRTVKLNSVSTFENLIGGSGADSLTGNSLSNTLTGGSGDDKLNGTTGSDLLFGGLNNDTYLFGASSAGEADQITENASEGTDTLSFATQTTSVTLSLATTAIQPVHTNRTVKLNSVSTFENAVGGTGSDTLLGNALENRLTGGNGDNILIGMEGNDILEAGNGRDILIGGLGLDTLNGGAGDDILIAGRTTSDTSLSSLNTLRIEWISINGYATRIANLRAGVGSPAVSLKTTINVLNDAGDDDSLTGGANSDWFFRALDDVITDLFAGEVQDVL
jgi:Ca2+-binding RTX toxin-like protein